MGTVDLVSEVFDLFATIEGVLDQSNVRNVHPLTLDHCRLVVPGPLITMNSPSSNHIARRNWRCSASTC